MNGEPIPYMLRADWFITCIVLLCFFLGTFVLKDGKKYLLFRIKKLFQGGRKNNHTTIVANAYFHHSIVLNCITYILGGLCLYDYFADHSSYLFTHIPHGLLLTIYIFTVVLFILLKYALYSFINWIFFEKEQNKAWIETYFDVIILGGLLLFPVVLLIIYFDLNFATTKVFILFILIFTKILLFYKCIRNFFKQIHGILHLILYFCALELAPSFLLWEGINYTNLFLFLNF